MNGGIHFTPVLPAAPGQDNQPHRARILSSIYSLSIVMIGAEPLDRVWNKYIYIVSIYAHSLALTPAIHYKRYEYCDSLCAFILYQLYFNAITQLYYDAIIIT